MLRERVLIVDDEVDVLDLCRRVLEVEGYQVTTAQNGQEALQQARKHSFDLLLTDIKMPGLTGLEVAQALKELDSNMVFVTMTGFSTMNMAIEALRLGIDEFIVKPFTPDDLISSVSKALERVRLRRENIRLRALIPLFELSKTFLSTIHEDDILAHVVRISQKETHASGALIALLDASSGRTVTCQATGLLANVPIGPRGAGWPIPWMVLDRGEDLSISSSDDIADVYRQALEQIGANSLIANPLIMQGRPIGVLCVAREAADASFSLADTEMLGILGGQAGIAVSNARLFAEIQQAYDELKKLDHMKSEFINIAAHELRTPLAILMGYASILEDEATGETRERMEIVVRNAMRLRSLMDDMLNLRYLETGESAYTPEPVQFSDIARSALTDMLPLARDKSQDVRVDVPDSLPIMLVDRQKLEIALTNLLSNSIKFTPSKGRIALTARVDSDHLLVAIEDTGIGIPPDAYERIFEPFVQIEDSLTREHGGIGLGLTIARGMVERCGGTIMVQSVLGKGSRFLVRVPLQPA
jgi:signal transduction histidine kinase/CheY-like chemotaxis protein